MTVMRNFRVTGGIASSDAGLRWLKTKRCVHGVQSHLKFKVALGPRYTIFSTLPKAAPYPAYQNSTPKKAILKI